MWRFAHVSIAFSPASSLPASRSASSAHLSQASAISRNVASCSGFMLFANRLQSSAYLLNFITLGMAPDAVPLMEQLVRGTHRSATSRQGDQIGDGTTRPPKRWALAALRYA